MCALKVVKLGGCECSATRVTAPNYEFLVYSCCGGVCWSFFTLGCLWQFLSPPVCAQIALRGEPAVTPFGDRVLYYDGTTLYCLSSTGSELWKYMVGSGQVFRSATRWLPSGWASLHILDRNGRVTYNDRLSDTIQFARPGSQFVAAAVGNMVSPTLLVKDVNGLAVDSDTVA